MPDKQNIRSICMLIVPIVVLVIVAEVIDIRLFSRIATILLINLILVLGLQIFTGNSGILSFAHIGFMGVGAYTTAVLTMPAQMKSMALPDLYLVLKTVEIDPILGILAGGAGAAMVATVISYPLMRLSDAAAVITSFAVLVIMHTVMVHWSSLTNGPRTLFGIVNATDLKTSAAAAIVAVVMALWFKESRTGILLRATRDDVVASGAIGADITTLRWKAFILSALYAGIGGGLWAHFITSFSPNAFYLRETFVILGMLVIGGAATVSGAVFGTFAVTAAFEGLRSFENTINAAQILSRPVVGLTEIVLACAMIGILILKPGGIIETSEIGELAWWKNAFGKKPD
ncbi:ABC transporter, permease protein 2 (cluster 4, leucine/isoleucine/valine/benzoate) [Olavius sp. associated proteobacterium Delta 1]|nr:ABC transporter, permease protein 2 (cluster 4, leucine/isoleucine/valine/benzoate) [Olavius sp. associated proteobacterium Delta 1]